ncbi:prephenate dehydrogenase/arogenate dehydrogenase family protein [Sulfobacillus harzensis]|uniref:Prephenate dehydrogenase n=1 Tax=Sulfobacillus harzensis TaxID=2729629 RepID=A0A7Y0L340_9FIRM|nr:prephenate dehydrogenase [Sulfobacillus harzensis]
MKVGIVGAGLIGGSMARRLADCRVPLWLDDGDPATRQALEALHLGEVRPWQDWIADVDAVVLAVPTGVVGRVVNALLPVIKDNTWLVDVSSVKRPVAEVLRTAGQRVPVMALHIMAGRETSGFSASDANLFQGRPMAVVDIGLGFPAPEAVAWWQERLGTEPASYWSLEQHDEHIAWVSQLPYLVSRALRTVVETHVGGMPALAGPGYRDTTRVGASSLKNLEDLLWANRVELMTALNVMASEIEGWRAILSRGERGCFN